MLQLFILFYSVNFYSFVSMKVKRTKTKWMRPYKLAELWGTTKQNIQAMKSRDLIESKVDAYGNVLVRGIGENKVVTPLNV